MLVPLISSDTVGGLDNFPACVEAEHRLGMVAFAGAAAGDVAVYETGDSMAPVITSGSMLLLRRVENWREYLGYGQTFCLVLTDGRRVTKVVNRHDSDPENYVVCHSYNAAYADEALPRSLIMSVFKVVAVQTVVGW